MGASPRANDDLRRMRRALALARRGRGKTSPNPLVGCVLAKGGRIVGEGWHARFGGPHAEAAALAAAGVLARGAVAYVTLEPCCHEGKKTPPCAQALAAAGVRRVVAAMRDPNPRVFGRGLRLLRRAGIEVSSGLLEAQARALNPGFISRMTRGRPYVILKAAASLDGRIETAGRESKWISSPAARSLSRRMRAEVDAILVGVNTVLADDPRLSADRPERNPLRVVLDTRGRVPRGARLLRQAGRTLLASSRFSNGLPPEVERLRLPRRGSGLDLRALLRCLSRRGVGTLLVEGGSAVHTSFLEAGLVDEVRLFLAPRLIGGAGARSFFEGRGTRRLAGALTLSRLTLRRVGPDLLVSGRLS